MGDEFILDSRGQIGQIITLTGCIIFLAGTLEKEAEAYMTYVIAEPCIGTKDTACVDVCPVDCIHPRKDEPEFEAAELLYIHPDECIDCGACEPACPVQAIFTEDDLPEQWRHFTQINADWYAKK
jgi:NAD-dependent dihydropyrimidine dehydrogenase PreA subunit